MNIYLSEVKGKRKSCLGCGIVLDPSNSNVSIGYYVNGKYRRAIYGCRECYVDQIHTIFKKGVYQLVVRSGCKVRWLSDEQITVGA